MKALDLFWKFLDRPIYPWARLALVLLVVPVGLSFTKPLWEIQMWAHQYPNGLELQIYAHKLESGNGGKDLHEINTLNHYIGMKKIDRTELSDLDWLPFALGILVILALRVAAIGNVRALVDLTVMSFYIGAFALGRFYYRMYVFGHDLDPNAPFKMEPFTPVMFGKREIANFTTAAYPGMGSIYLGLFGVGLVVILLWHLIQGRIETVRAQRAAAAAIWRDPNAER